MKTKKLSLALFFTFLAAILFAQDDFATKISKKLLAHSQNNVVEKAYLHTDKPYYVAGENLWFKGYLVEGIKHKADSLSGVLYVDLVQNQTGHVVQNGFYKLVGGLGDGQITLPDSLLPGAYTLRAYTKWMRNFDENYFFKQDIEILNPKRTTTNTVASFDFDLNFFPEGGDLIDDLQTKIAFKSIDQFGKSIDSQGFITSDKGDTLTKISSEYLGMGFFRLRPKAGTKYTATVTALNKTKTFLLPEVKESGFMLSIDNLSSAEAVGINIKAKLPENLLNKRMFVVAQSRGNSIFSAQFTSSNSKTVQSSPRIMFPDGIIQFTIFDEAGHPFSERIIYNNNPKLLNISVKTQEENNNSRKETTLLIEATDRDGRPVDANLSVAVTDGEQVIEPKGYQNIVSYLSLSSDIKGKIEEPSAYFDKSNPNAAKNLDLLMMTQGWRRFSWKEVLHDSPKNYTFLPEPSLAVSGTVKQTNDKTIKNPVQINGFYGTKDKKSFVLGESDAKGKFVVYNFDFTDTAVIALQAMTGPKDKIYKIIVDSILMESGKKQTIATHQLFGNENNRYLENSLSVIQQEKNAISLELGEVKVAAKKVVKDDYRRPYGDKTVKVVKYKQGESVGGLTVLESLQSKFPGVEVRCFGLECTVKIRGNVSMGGNNNAQLLLDGMPVDAATIQSIPLSEVEQVDILQGPAAAIYGIRGATGLVNVLTRRSNPNFDYSNYKTEGMFLFKKIGYVANKEFYMPKYAENPAYAAPDSRPTIFWSPNVEVKDGKAVVKYYNSGEKTKVNVNIQGKNENGALGATSMSYQVSK
jgi:TonB-dependent Receptor Plug Domain